MKNKKAASGIGISWIFAFVIIFFFFAAIYLPISFFSAAKKVATSGISEEGTKIAFSNGEIVSINNFFHLLKSNSNIKIKIYEWKNLSPSLASWGDKDKKKKEIINEIEKTIKLYGECNYYLYFSLKAPSGLSGQSVPQTAMRGAPSVSGILAQYSLETGNNNLAKDLPLIPLDSDIYFKFYLGECK
ncbi:hypothetical protein HYW76_01845 [Candidatus Pacearchaeota archaeon]|nr:hypothetical protein [Candidatus Pacearchaeota archaeon]